MYSHILVPLDGTPLADRCTEQALALARLHDAKVCFLHVQPDFAATEDGALLLSLSPELYADAAGDRTSWVLTRAEAAARSAGIECRSIAMVSDKPHVAILEAVLHQGCDLVFMASHGRRGLLGSRLGGVTQRVLNTAQVPVLVAAVEVNTTLDGRSRALDIIRAEHRSLGAVVQAMQHHWRQVTQQGAAPRFDLLRAMLYYIEQFPQRLHHPKEDEHLFARLRARTSECDAVLERLQAQHRDGEQQFEALRLLLADVEAGRAGAGARFGAALDSFVKGQWQHRQCEEHFVLPAAIRWLAPDDWEAIAAAFGANGDPRFDVDDNEAFDQLAERVLRLAAMPAPAA